MMDNIAFGQYYPGNSPIHRLDPRAKLIITVLYIIAVFLCHNVYSFIALTASMVVIMLISRIPVKMLLKSMKPLLLIMAFTAFFNIFWIKGETPLLQWRFINIYVEGIVTAELTLVRIVALILCTSIFMTFTTSPIALTDAIEQLLAPLKKIKLPVHEFAMMMTIALRFIPTLIEETNKIISAQKARGADFESGNLMQRAKALIPVLVPLFVSAFRRADDLAVAMECRCYHGGEGRTRMNILKYVPRDFVAMGIFVLFGAAVVLINHFLGGFSI